MFFKMEDNRHPHAEMAGFVNRYLQHIKSMLEEGNLEPVKEVIKDVGVRYGSASRRIMKAKEGANKSYFLAIDALIELTEIKNPSIQRIRSKACEASRRVYELELILQGDEIYEKFRQRKAGG